MCAGSVVKSKKMTTSYDVELTLKMLPVEDLLVRELFLSPSGSRVNVSPLRGDVCWISRQRSGAAGSQCMVRLWWVPLQLAAVWVPLERHEISVHGAVVVCSSSTSNHVGTSGKFLFFLSRLHLLLFLHLVQLFWKKISLRWGRSPRFSMVLLTSQNGVAAPSHLPENDAFFSPAPLFLIHEPLPPTLHPSLLVSLFFLFLKISFP